MSIYFFKPKFILLQQLIRYYKEQQNSNITKFLKNKTKMNFK